MTTRTKTASPVLSGGLTSQAQFTMTSGMGLGKRLTVSFTVVIVFMALVCNSGDLTHSGTELRD